MDRKRARLTKKFDHWANESKRSNVLLSDMRGSIWINDQSEQLDASDKTYLKMMRNEHALILYFDLLL